MHHTIAYQTIQLEVVDAEIFMINNINHLCIVEYYSKFPIIKRVARLSAVDLVHATNNTSAELGLSREIISDARMNF